MTTPLKGLRVFDISRILAGPTCTQLLGDLGADIIKVERPGHGDDTRKWGPPYLKDKDGIETRQSAYYLSSNRNKRSITIDISTPEGQALARRMIAQSDILVENFKVGGMEKYGLSYADLKPDNPGLIYCSITGFGQTGPYASRPGYDYLAQAMGGLMSLTGEPDGAPMRVGIGIADVMCGMYASTAILAALRHRDQTGEGQAIDLALLDTQVGWLISEGVSYLTSGDLPVRHGDEHANIVPYKVFKCADDYLVLAVGNDGQFIRFCAYAGIPELSRDPRFETNSNRIENRQELYEILPPYMEKKTRAEWLEGLEAIDVPAGPVNNIEQVFSDPQIIQRGMKLEMPLADSEGGSIDLISNPINLSGTPVSYRYPPPTIGEHTEELLRELLDLEPSEIDGLRERGVV
jgi:crotonobetainyl-CoA:carnitine CoA-transferase CaiB-like acyl-CoA transferase